MVKPYVAFIGSRNLVQFPAAWVALYEAAARAAARDYVLRTGACDGADQRAADTALEAGGEVHLCLPWWSYEWVWVDSRKLRYPGQVAQLVYDRLKHPEWTNSVTEFHPASAALSRGALALHARNYGIVAPCEFGVALPSLERGGGGTGQGLRVGDALGVPVYDLRQELHRRHIEEWLTAQTVEGIPG